MIWPTELDKYDKGIQEKIKHLPMSLIQIKGKWERSPKKSSTITLISELCGCDKELIKYILHKECGYKYTPKKEFLEKMKIVEFDTPTNEVGPAEKKHKSAAVHNNLVVNFISHNISEIEKEIEKNDLEFSQLQQQIEKNISLGEELEEALMQMKEIMNGKAD